MGLAGRRNERLHSTAAAGLQAVCSDAALRIASSEDDGMLPADDPAKPLGQGRNQSVPRGKSVAENLTCGDFFANEDSVIFSPAVLSPCCRGKRDSRYLLGCRTTRNLVRQLLLLPSERKSFLVGWPPGAAASVALEKSKKLIASWDS